MAAGRSGPDHVTQARPSQRCLGNGLRGAAPPKKLRLRTGLVVHIAIIAMLRCPDAIPTWHRAPAGPTAPRPGSAVGRGSPGTRTDAEVAAGIRGPMADQ